jgi:scyllo-inosamine-4-phosphate amidinotransferase 1
MLASNNEWDTLNEIVVGKADFANWPSTDPVFARESEKTLWTATPVPTGPVPQQIIDESNEDLEALCDALRKESVVVHRPGDMNFQELGGMYNYCPRDRLLVAGTELVDCNMMYPCRNMEIDALPMVTSQAAKIHTMPRDQDMILDAANISRLGDTWLYLMSHSGNQAAYEWLCAQFPDKTIEACNFYAGVHIDSTIVPIREGVALINGSRVRPGELPNALKGWRCVYINDVVPQGFHNYPYASKWIALNMLMVNPHLAIVDKHQRSIIQILKSLDVEVIPLELRHSRTLGGGFHCVTLDLVRTPL